MPKTFLFPCSLTRLSGFAITLLLLFGLASAAHAQSEFGWTWVSGSNNPDNQNETTGSWGVKGVPAPTNVPSSRTQPAQWTDKQGNFWLFGGVGPDATSKQAVLDDLWKYDVSTGEWTWVTGSNFEDSGNYGPLGVASPDYYPGPRYRAGSWVDKNGRLWLFGGMGFDPSYPNAGGGGGYSLGDLWMFDPTTSEWTWVSGTQATGDGQAILTGVDAYPGHTWGATTWTDSNGDLWLFGGYGNDGTGNTTAQVGFLNYLWVYSPVSNLWRYVSGTPVTQFTYPNIVQTDNASVETYATPNYLNQPGGRYGAIAWSDDHGNSYLFGGEGLDSNGNWGFLNDLWVHDNLYNEWVLFQGSATIPQVGTYAFIYGGSPGVYNTEYSENATSYPGSREFPLSWIDSSSNLWLYGGYGYDSVGARPYFLSDLWKLDVTTGEWAWMGGNSAFSIAVNYGTKGVYASTNFPGPRNNSSTFVDNNGNPWFFGGSVADSAGDTGIEINDLWSLTLYTPTPTFTTAAGTYAAPVSVSLADSISGAAIYYTTDGSTPTASSTNYTAPFTVSATTTINAIAIASGFYPSNVASANYVVNIVTPQAPAPTFSVAAGTYSTAFNLALADSLSSATIYYTTDGSTPSASSTHYTAPFTLSSTTTVQAIAIAPNYTASTVASALYTLVTSADFTLAASPASQTVTAGSAANFTINLASANGIFASPVQLSVAGLPKGYSAYFSTSGAVPGTSGSTSTLTVNTAAYSVENRKPLPWAPMTALALLAFLPFRRVRKMGRGFFVALLLFVALVSSAALTGCGGSSSKNLTQSVTLTVTGTSGALSHSTSVQLTVN